MLLRVLSFRPLATPIGLTLSLHFCLASCSTSVNGETANVSSTHSPVNLAQNGSSTINQRDGLPIHRRGGGSRGNCLALGGQLVALVPKHSVGLTTSTAPQLFFSLPDTQTTPQLELVVRNQQDQLVYETFIETKELETKERPGIIALTFPAHFATESLQTQENYHWYLSLLCSQHNRAHDLVVSGWLRRIELDPQLRQQLQASAPLEQAHLYQQQGLWHDALSAVVQAQKTPHERGAAQAKWTELLTALGLGELATQPLIWELELP